MKKIDLGQLIGILANVGVIVGIVVLIVEINQNNEALSFQARTMITTARSAEQLGIAYNTGGIVDLLEKSRSGDPLTWAEDFRLDVWAANAVRTYQALHREALRGSLPERDLPVGQWRAAFRAEERFREFFARNRDELDPEFVRFIDENVIEEDSQP